MGVDARRTGQEQGAKPQCALAAIRNVTRNPHICNDTLTLFPHDLGRGWEGKDSTPRLSNRNESITRIPWVKLLEFITLPSEEKVWRAACEVVSRLEDKLISYINRAIIPENRGRGPATHVTVIIRDHLNTLQPSWHYLDNDASPFPQPRPLFSTNLTAGQVRNKVRENRSVIYITTATHSPLDLLLHNQLRLRESDARESIDVSDSPPHPAITLTVTRPLAYTQDHAHVRSMAESNPTQTQTVLSNYSYIPPTLTTPIIPHLPDTTLPQPEPPTQQPSSRHRRPFLPRLSMMAIQRLQ